MSIAVAFEARGERGRNLSEVLNNNYTNGNNEYGQGRTITATYNFTRGDRLVFRKYDGGNGGDHSNSTTKWLGAPGGAAAALRLGDTTDIVIAGGGGGMGGRLGNDGGDAGSYQVSTAVAYHGGEDGGWMHKDWMRGRGGNQGIGGGGGGSYNDGNTLATAGANGGTRDGGNGGNGGTSHGDGGGGGGGGFGGGGGGGGHGDNSDSNKNNSGGGGGGDSFLHSSAYGESEILNTNTTAQVIITYDGTDVTLDDDGDEFIVSTPTTFNDTTFSFEKDRTGGIFVSDIEDEGVFTEDIDKNFTFFARVAGSGNSFTEFGSQNFLQISPTINRFRITLGGGRYFMEINRTASAVETIEMEVYTEATVTGITETSNTFIITLEFTNNPPTVTAITQSVHWNSIDNSFNFSGSDLDGDPLTYRIATTAGSSSYGTSISDANNSVTVDGSQFIVDSSNNATFRFFYIANDGFNDSTPAQITINKSNNKPTANEVTYTMHWNSSKTFGFSGNDANSDSLTYVISSGSGGSFSDGPLNLTEGIVTIDSINTNQFSVDSLNHTNFTFYYKAFDGAEYSTVGTITIVKINTAPTASNIVRFTHTDEVTITLSGSDRDSDSFTFHKNGNPTETYGTWDDSDIAASVSVIKYTPTGNSLGSDTYGYYVSDSVGSSNYTITVYSGLTNIKDGGQDLTELYKRKHDNTAGNITLTNNKSNYQVNGNDLVDYFERENGAGTSTSNLKVTVGATTYALDQIFKKR